MLKLLVEDLYKYLTIQADVAIKCQIKLSIWLLPP